MDINSKYFDLITTFETVFETIPEEVKEALAVVRKEFISSDKYKRLYVKYFIQHKDKYKFALTIHNHMKSGMSFDKAVAKAICEQ